MKKKKQKKKIDTVESSDRKKMKIRKTKKCNRNSIG